MIAPEITVGLIALISFSIMAFVIVRRNRKRAKLAPRDRRRFDRKLQIFGVVLLTGVALMMFYRGQTLSACLFAIVCASTLYGIVNQPMRHDDIDARVNYAHDSGCCGRCDYDLTGNESGVCPECGWQVPASREFAEPPHWAHWWKSWEIQHIEQWRKSLATCLVTMVVAFGMVVGFWVWHGKPSPFLFLLAAMGVNHLILVVRIIAYAKRQRAE